MFAYVARQPIFDSNKNVFGYELLFRNGEKNCFPDIEPDEATSKILADSHLSYGLDEVTDGKVSFINFHQNTLLRHFPTSLDPKTTVVEIVESVDVNEALIKACKQIRERGYKLAIDDYDHASHWTPFLDFVNIVKIEVGAHPIETLKEIITTLKRKNITLVVERVETIEEFEMHKELGFDYFQGYFLAKPQVIRHRKLGVSKLAMLDLLTESIKPALDTKKITSIFECDAALTFKLLRFINNPTINKSNSITSLRHAINYMGEREVKKFIALLALANLNESGQTELLAMSLVRAKFCEFVANKLNIQDDPPFGYLTGLLSLMDAITSQSMETLSNKLPLNESVQSALLGKDGALCDCLRMAAAFERADWKLATTIKESYEFDLNEIHKAYISSLSWASKILNAQVG